MGKKEEFGKNICFFNVCSDQQKKHRPFELLINRSILRLENHGHHDDESIRNVHDAKLQASSYDLPGDHSQCASLRW